MHQNPNVQAGPNDFTLGIDGPDPALEVGGTHGDQERQRDFLQALDSRAALSYASRAIGVRVPSDGNVERILSDLSPTPPIGEDGREVTHAVYRSTIPNATAREAFEHFINNPNEVFNAGGMEIRPPTAALEDGGRYMLEAGGPPPAWLPVQVTVDAANNAFTIQTLDGHVLRGEQTFTFTDDREGGTTLTQDARFQAGTALVGDLQHATSISGAQHESWQFAHRELYEQFNEDPDYAGMGIDFDGGKWLVRGLGLLTDPGGTADLANDTTGEIAEETLDPADGRIDGGADRLTQRLGVPGRDVAENATDGIGDRAEDVLDAAGDGASWLADKTGGGAKAVVDFVNPFD